jgi:hypothetical protein
VRCFASFSSFITFFLLLHSGSRFAQDQQIPTPEDWQRAERAIRRLPPSEFKQAPNWVIDDLTVRGCAIPQPFYAREPSNLIRGQFARRGEWDWAAICSKGGKSQLIVLWAGPPACPSHVGGKIGDAGRLEGEGSGEIGYDLSIVRIGPEQIRKDIRDWREPSRERIVKEIAHDGIELPSGKGDDIEYCLRGEWMTPAHGD